MEKTISLTSKQIEEELKRENYKFKYKKILKSTIYFLIGIVALATIISTLIMPVLEVNETSMEPALKNGEIVLSLKTKNFNTGDVIAFYHGNKILIKRVIATAGSFVSINENGDVYVDGNLLKENYLKEKTLNQSDIEFPYQVPENSYFVLSDDRIDINDSRNSEIGCISKENIIGKIIFRVWPFKSIGLVG